MQVCTSFNLGHLPVIVRIKFTFADNVRSFVIDLLFQIN